MENKFYIYLTGWQGMTEDAVKLEEADYVEETREKAEQTARKAFEEWLDIDEHVYIYHNGELEEYI